MRTFAVAQSIEEQKQRLEAEKQKHQEQNVHLSAALCSPNHGNAQAGNTCRGRQESNG
jgi:hypothetical protein